MKKTSLFLIMIPLYCLTGCLKDTPAVDFSTVGTIIEILPPNGGAENFDGAALDFDPSETLDSMSIVVNIAAPKPLGKPLTVTFGLTDSARTAYNIANGDDYMVMPDSDYSFPVRTVTIPAGHHLDTLQVYFYPSRIDSTQSYMLPISITDAQKQPISGNFSTVYFHYDAP